MNDQKGLLGLLSTCLKSYGAAASSTRREKMSRNLCAFCAQWQKLLIRLFFFLKKKRAQEGSTNSTTIALFIAVATSSKANSLINFVASSTLLKVLLEQKLHPQTLALGVPKKNFLVCSLSSVSFSERQAAVEMINLAFV